MADVRCYFWGAGQVSGPGGVSIGLRGMFDAAVVFSPAWLLAAHWPAGMNAWMNANAGAAGAPTNRRATTKVRSILRVALTFSHLPSLKERGDQPRLKLYNATTVASVRY
jgi:hypothetical protein